MLRRLARPWHKPQALAQKPFRRSHNPSWPPLVIYHLMHFRLLKLTENLCQPNDVKITTYTMLDSCVVQQWLYETYAVFPPYLTIITLGTASSTYHVSSNLFWHVWNSLVRQLTPKVRSFFHSSFFGWLKVPVSCIPHPMTVSCSSEIGTFALMFSFTGWNFEGLSKKRSRKSPSCVVLL